MTLVPSRTPVPLAPARAGLRPARCWLPVLAVLTLLAGCGGGAPAGGMDNGGSATATAGAGGPGFLTSTPPPGGGAGVQVTPPPGSMGSTVTPSPAPTATKSPTLSAQATAPRPASSGTAGATGTPTPPPASFLTPTPEATDTPVAVATPANQRSIQVSMVAPAAVQRGGTATIQATSTVPGAICTLTVRYRTASSNSAPSFPVETADANGSIAWSWTIPQDVVPGTWPVTVRCQVGLPLDDPNAIFAYATNLLPVR